MKQDFQNFLKIEINEAPFKFINETFELLNKIESSKNIEKEKEIEFMSKFIEIGIKKIFFINIIIIKLKKINKFKKYLKILLGEFYIIVESENQINISGKNSSEFNKIYEKSIDYVSDPTSKLIK
jgi:hypothetical protein